MKKLLSLMVISGFIYVWSTVLWASTWTTTVDTPIDGKAFNQASAEVQNIEVRFCQSDAKTKKFAITAGLPEEICLEIVNSADKDILISMDFVDGTLTNDQWKNRACLDNNAKELFGQYMTGVESSFVIPAKGTVVKHPILTYPKGTKGTILGCLVYYTQWVSLWWAMDFNILVRRAKFIDVIIKEPFRDTYKRIIIGIAIVLVAFWLYKKAFPLIRKHIKIK